MVKEIAWAWGGAKGKSSYVGWPLVPCGLAPVVGASAQVSAQWRQTILRRALLRSLGLSRTKPSYAAGGGGVLPAPRFAFAVKGVGVGGRVCWLERLPLWDPAL